MEVGVVERIYVGPQAFAQSVRQVSFSFDRSNGGERGLQRRQAFRLNCRYIHIRVVQIGDFAGIRSSRSVRPGGFLNQDRGILVGYVVQPGENTDTGAVCRNNSPLDPVPIGILVEVVSWQYGPIYIGDVDSVGCRLRFILRALGMENQPRRGQKHTSRSDDNRMEAEAKSHITALLEFHIDGPKSRRNKTILGHRSG